MPQGIEQSPQSIRAEIKAPYLTRQFGGSNSLRVDEPLRTYHSHSDKLWVGAPVTTLVLVELSLFGFFSATLYLGCFVDRSPQRQY